MNPQQIRNLSQAELDLLPAVGLEHFIPTEFRYLRVDILCIQCKRKTFQYVKLAKHYDGTWLKVKEDISINEADFPIECCTVHRQFCQECYTQEDVMKIVTPLYYQSIINKEHDYLISMTTNRTLSKDAVFSSMKVAAQRAALFFGDIENWRAYLPKQLKGRIRE
jgi:hypothetical protein